MRPKWRPGRSSTVRQSWRPPDDGLLQFLVSHAKGIDLQGYLEDRRLQKYFPEDDGAVTEMSSTARQLVTGGAECLEVGRKSRRASDEGEQEGGCSLPGEDNFEAVLGDTAKTEPLPIGPVQALAW